MTKNKAIRRVLIVYILQCLVLKTLPLKAIFYYSVNYAAEGIIEEKEYICSFSDRSSLLRLLPLYYRI